MASPKRKSILLIDIDLFISLTDGPLKSPLQWLVNLFKGSGAEEDGLLETPVATNFARTDEQTIERVSSYSSSSISASLVPRQYPDIVNTFWFPE